MNGPITIGVAGLGLIGGSFALDVQEHGHGVVGYDIDEESCKLAMELGIAMHASCNIAALDDCAAVLVAVPVGETKQVFAQLAKLDMPNLQAIFDAGSVKGCILEDSKSLGEKTDKFVPCHPIAGTEHSGVRAAFAGLFKRRRLIMCSSPAKASARQVAQALWEQCGSTVDEMSAEEHDRVFATVSHLPHMLAFSLVGSLGSRKERDELLANAASGFADFTRIASSDPSMWRDVCLANRKNLTVEIDSYIKDLRKLRDAVDASDGNFMHEFFENARVLRDTWVAKLEERQGDKQ